MMLLMLAATFAVAQTRPEMVTPGVGQRPLSAIQKHHTLEVLADGTHIENNSTARVFRDAEGRVRVERRDGTASIDDGVQGVAIELDPSTRTARVSPLPRVLARMRNQRRQDPIDHMPIIRPRDDRGAQPRYFSGSPGETRTEDLGHRTVNGVLARGTRFVITIPAGAIGNDRPIQVTNEFWVSHDLGITVKQSTSDPRHGETTDELVDIDQRAPDPSLFQIPPGYRIIPEQPLETP